MEGQRGRGEGGGASARGMGGSFSHLSLSSFFSLFSRFSLASLYLLSLSLSLHSSTYNHIALPCRALDPHLPSRDL